MHTFPLVSSHLKKVSSALVQSMFSSPNGHKKSDTGKPSNKKNGTSCQRFTPKEDECLKAAIREAGEGAINASYLAKRLNRSHKSVSNRIESIKRNGGVIKQMNFTLVEDLLVLDRLILPRVGNEKLSKIVLKQHQYLELTRQFNKSKEAIKQRWQKVLQPWLLQHYSG